METQYDATTSLASTIERIEGAYAPATVRAYRADFETFIQFCSVLGEDALPASPKAVAQFVENLARTNHKSSSIRRAVAGISAIHRLNRLPDPTKDPDVTLEMRRMHRQLGRFSKQAYAIDANLLEKLIAATDNSAQGIRNRALLSVAYDTLCRRSELVSLQREDIQFERNSTEELISSRILLRRSKTDPFAQGRWLELGAKATKALASWLEASKIQTVGPIFYGLCKGNRGGLTSGQVNRILKRLAVKAELPPESIQTISGHSIRIGAARDLMKQGASMPLIMKSGRWSKTDTVMRYLDHWSGLTPP